MEFRGFLSEEKKQVKIPESFFKELLPFIGHIGELKITIYTFWWLYQMEGSIHFIRRSDYFKDTTFINGLADNNLKVEDALDQALTLAVNRGTLLEAKSKSSEPIYFLNSPRGRAALKGLQQGKWQPEEFTRIELDSTQERANIYQLYEANIGPLTPIIADILRDAEASYPKNWIEEALQIAVENNVRRWRYVEAILRSWQDKGRDDRKTRPDSKEDYKKYIEGEFSKFIKR